MSKMRTTFFLDEKPIETISNFLYTSPQPFGTIKFDQINYRIVRYSDVFLKENNSRIITREVYLKQEDFRG